MKKWPGILILTVISGVLLFSRAMNTALSHDEFQFVASAQLLASRGLLPYINYPFLHMPYIVPINGLAAALTSYDFLAVRSLGVLWGTGSALVIYLLALRLLHSVDARLRQTAALAAGLVFVLDPVFVTADGRALNHLLPGLISLLAFACCRRAFTDTTPWRWYGLCGLLSGLAAGTRLSYAVLIVVFAGAVLVLPRSRTLRARLGDLLALGLGVFIALLPVLALFVAAPQKFFYGNYVYIHLNTLYRQLVEHAEAMTLGSKLLYFVQYVLVNPLDAFFYAAFSLFLIAAIFRWWKHIDPLAGEALLAAGLGLALFTTAFVPTPTWPQYFFAPLPFLVIGFLYGLAWLSRRRALYGFTAIGILLALALASGVAGNLRDDLEGLQHPAEWQTVQVHRFAMQLREVVPAGKVLTLAPILPLEAGLDTYEVFAVGSFSWRTAHLVGADLRQAYGIVARRELDAYLKADPPAAVLVGFEEGNLGFGLYDSGNLEKPLDDYARRLGFHFRNLNPSFIPTPLILWTP